MMQAGNRKILVYRPGQIWLLAAATAMLLLTAAYVLFDQGQQHAGGAVGRLQQERNELEQLSARQRAQIVELREQIAVLQRAGEIDRRATLEVRNDFAALQDELLGLRKELEFYRGIVSPGEVKHGLQVQQFNLEPGQEPGSFAFNLTLTQVKRNDRYVTGAIEISVQGVEDGEDKVLPFDQLLVGDQKDLKYRFRYFQHFEGMIRIPADFQPRQISIRLSPRGKGQPPGIEEVVEWPV